MGDRGAGSDPDGGAPIVDPTVEAGVLAVRRPDTAWLSTGWNGGRSRGGAAYTVSVPEGFDRTDLEAYRRERFDRAGVDADAAAPTLFTGVDLDHARIARSGPASVIATVGLSNPAALFAGDRTPVSDGRDPTTDGPDPAGTVNLIAVVDRDLSAGALANLVAVVAEAKAATLGRLAGVPGTTSDAVVVGCDPGGEAAAFSGSATPVGAATRACVRDAVRASFESRYADRPVPDSVADAAHGVVTDRAVTIRPI